MEGRVMCIKLQQYDTDGDYFWDELEAAVV